MMNKKRMPLFQLFTHRKDFLYISTPLDHNNGRCTICRPETLIAIGLTPCVFFDLFFCPMRGPLIFLRSASRSASTCLRLCSRSSKSRRSCVVWENVHMFFFHASGVFLFDISAAAGTLKIQNLRHNIP